MASLAVDLVVFFFESISVIVAVSAFVLAIKWKKNEFLAGLFFLLLWSVLNAIDVMLATVLDQPFINASQFGFILLALVSFIIGMRPATVFQRRCG